MPRHKDAPSGRSGRSSRRKRKPGQQQQGTNRITGKERTLDERNRNNALQRFDEPRLERVPSNAPTMAIAPSDYEHIYHDDVHANAAIQPNTELSPPSPSPAMPSPPPPPPPQTPTRLTVPPLPPPPPAPRIERPVTPSNPNAILPTTPNENEYTATTQRQYDNFNDDLQVTPDGYTLLGHRPDTNRRVALPAYIVRANNQFSRAVLARVARYLASRADLSSHR